MCKSQITQYVTTSFLQYKNKILILKRSKKVGSFQGKYAGISGSIEIPPAVKIHKLTDNVYKKFALKQAYIEIKEETNLNPTDIKLLKKGDLFIVESQTEPYYNWYVFPFLFKLITHPHKISLNWENTSYKFVKPEEILLYKTVPQLPFVLYEFFIPKNILAKIMNLNTDNQSGSLEIAHKVIEICKIIPYKKSDKNIRLLYTVLKYLKPMAIVYNIIELIRKGEKVQNIQMKLKKEEQRLIKKAKQIIKPGSTIIAYSYSSTLFKIFFAIANITVYLPHEPHSLRLLKKLQENKVKARILKHLNTSKFNDSKFIISCDALIARKYIINAKGTLRFIKKIKKRGIKTYCFVQKMKIIKEKDFKVLKKIMSSDFEVIPLNLIDHYIIA